MLSKTPQDMSETRARHGETPQDTARQGRDRGETPRDRGETPRDTARQGRDKGETPRDRGETRERQGRDRGETRARQGQDKSKTPNESRRNTENASNLWGRFGTLAILKTTVKKATPHKSKPKARAKQRPRQKE